MARAPGRYAYRLTWLAAAAVWLLAPAILWSLLQSGVVPAARATVVVLGLGVTAWMLSTRRRLGLLSPPYLLGSVALVFYSLGPALYLQLLPALPQSLFLLNAGHTATVDYVGSRGELLVLQFTALCFLLTALASRHAARAAGERSSTGPAVRAVCAYGAPALALALAIVALVAALDHPTAAILAGAMKGSLNTVIPPILAVSLAAAAFFAGDGAGRQIAATIALIVGTIAALFFAGGLATVPLYIAVASILLLVLRRQPGFRQLACLAGAFAGLVVIAILGRAALLPNAPAHFASRGVYLEALMVSKLVHRQATSGACLTRIAERYAGVEDRGPFYFLMAVVPRTFWPEKPTLSRGHEFALKYCGEGKAIDPHHSESITLIGEPILSAGAAGLLVAELFIALITAGATVAGLSGGATPLVGMTAMLPWLALFQQHFAQYVGNAVKMFLIMLPFLALLAWAERRDRARR